MNGVDRVGIRQWWALNAAADFYPTSVQVKVLHRAIQQHRPYEKTLPVVRALVAGGWLKCRYNSVGHVCGQECAVTITEQGMEARLAGAMHNRLDSAA